MITRIEARDFRCLRSIAQPMTAFHVLVGPNGSGKTTFLDVIAFLSRLVSDGLEPAISERTRNFQDLVWGRSGDAFELAVDLRIPEELREFSREPPRDTIRYEVRVGLDAESRELRLLSERIILCRLGASLRVVLEKDVSGRSRFEAEPNYPQSFNLELDLGAQRSALGNLPEDESKFPVTVWLKRQLGKSVRQLMLNSLALREASPPGARRHYRPDGSDLPWLVETLHSEASDRFDMWIAHLRTALPDLETMRVVRREDDRHSYLMLRYRGGFEVPSWMVSDGTLRLLALTILAYLPDPEGTILIEEPENGIHPGAVETVFQSLSSVYGAQVLLATHSPVVLGVADAASILCFTKDEEGATEIVRGSEHPALEDWRGEVNLGALFAGGVLG